MREDPASSRLLGIFLGELAEQLHVMSEELLGLEANPVDASRLRSLFRVVHTLKGAASSAGVPLVAECCHHLESLLADARSGTTVLGRDEFDLLLSAVDALEDARRRLSASEPLTGSPLQAFSGKLARRPAKENEPQEPSRGLLGRRRAREKPATPPASGEAESPSQGEQHGPTRVHSEPRREHVQPPPDPSQPLGGTSLRQGEGPPPQPAPRPLQEPARSSAAEPIPQSAPDEIVRVPLPKIEGTLALSGSLVMSERRIRTRAGEAVALNDMITTFMARTRTRTASRRYATADDSGTEGVPQPGGRSDDEQLQDLLRQVLRFTDDVARDARSLSSVTSQIADNAGRLLMRPFKDASQPLARTVRDVAAATGKKATLVVTGAEVEADRRVLDTLRDMLPHLVRNAVDHGIEAPADRLRIGKPASGTITVEASVRGRQLSVVVADDGAGFDVEGVRDALIKRGAAVPDSEFELLGTVFESGLSTRTEATATSGRGVGLDAVRAALTALGGSVTAESSPGRGARITISCPLDLALIRALLFSTAQRLLAIPSSAVERLIRLDPSRIHETQGRRVLSVPSFPAPVPLLSLHRLFDAAGLDGGGERHAVLVSFGNRQLAIAVDELLSEEEIVVRPVPQLGSLLPYISGAAILGGQVALVLNPPALVEAGVSLLTASGSTLPEERSRRRRILVVDDSITTRTLEQSVLEGAGYEVITAVDGAEGWSKLQEFGADLVVADVEMPRMNGFGLCESIRASERFRELPVVLVTALESQEDRGRGMEAGANAYLGKSSFNQATLIETVQNLLEDL